MFLSKITLLFNYILYIYCTSFDIVSDLIVDDCLSVNNPDKLSYYAKFDNKYPYCGKYPTDVSTRCRTIEQCEPGLDCDGGLCKVLDTTSCFHYYANGKRHSEILSLLWSPTCSEDGTWAPKQCKGGPSGRCFCYDAIGNRIFGQAFADSADKITCACSRRKSELLAKTGIEKRVYVSFHCDSMGNYEPLQCDSGNCWCADPMTGDLTSIIVPEKAMKLLDCFKNSGNFGNQYMRKCESKAYAQYLMMEKLRLHGTIISNIIPTPCQNDGSYGPYTIEKGQIFCVSRFNVKSAFHSPLIESDGVNCNCGTDGDLFTSLGKEFTLQCIDNGNYKLLQGPPGHQFCVDKDGTRKYEMTDDDNVDPNNPFDCGKFFPEL